MPLIHLPGDNPLTDARQSQTALDIRSGLMRHFEAHGAVVLAEFTLAAGRRADLLALDRKGRFTLVEIKSSIADYRADNKWHEYREWCDAFTFATAPEVPQSIFPREEGLIIADRYGAQTVREAAGLALPAARRKAMMLAFARQAALRLERLRQFAEVRGMQFPADDGEGRTEEC